MVRRDDHSGLILHVGEGIPAQRRLVFGTAASGEAAPMYVTEPRPLKVDSGKNRGVVGVDCVPPLAWRVGD
jgi:hypothetical protein